MESAAQNWHLRLFDKSVLKQAKWRAISRYLDDSATIAGLDLGADNGVVSHLLRIRGGTWHSADLDAHAVASIRDIVTTNVHQVDGKTLPFEDESFNIVVVIDMLEHLDDDAQLVREIHRVLREGGTVITNVPHIKTPSILRRVRLAAGLTDAWHGHVRPGYTRRQFENLLSPCFDILGGHTYNRAFSEFLDIALNYVYTRKSAKSTGNSSSKGSVVTRDDVDKRAKQFRLFATLYPFMRAWAALDALFAPFTGYSLILHARKKPTQSARKTNA